MRTVGARKRSAVSTGLVDNNRAVSYLQQIDLTPYKQLYLLSHLYCDY